MGKVEKIVVLSVLFLIVVILGVSWNSGREAQAGERDVTQESLDRERRVAELGNRAVHTAASKGQSPGADRDGVTGQAGAPLSVKPGAPVGQVAAAPNKKSGASAADLGSKPGSTGNKSKRSGIGRRRLNRPQDQLTQVKPVARQPEGPAQPPSAADLAGPLAAAKPSGGELNLAPAGPSQPDAPSGDVIGEAPILGVGGVAQYPGPQEVGFESSATGQPRAGDLRREGEYLMGIVGLSKSPNPAFGIYTCRAGDTFESLARRVYGKSERADLLRRNNEEVTQLTRDLRLLIPLGEEDFEEDETYEVQEGESLWRIAKKVYGKGTRWQEIYDANRGLLTNPNAVRAGMELRIP